MEFRGSLYELKAKNPDLSLEEIMRRIAPQLKEITLERKKRNDFWEKIQ